MKRSNFLVQLERLARALDDGQFLSTNGRPEARRLRNLAKRKRIDSNVIFLDSIRCKSGRAYLVAMRGHVESLACLEPSARKGGTPSMFRNSTRYVLHSDGKSVVAYVLPFTSDNLRKLMDEVLPEEGPKNLESTPRLGLGVRMLFTLPFLLKALDQVKVVSDFQLSAGREFSLTKVVESAPGAYPEWLGHTGLDASALYGTIAKECFKFGFPHYGTEIDHLIVTDKPEEAISRIRRPSANQSFRTGVGSVSEESVRGSIEYNRQVMDEATGTGFVRGMTIDTSALLRGEFDDMAKWTGQILREEFEKQLSEEDRRALMDRYHPGQPFLLKAGDDDGMLQLTFSEGDVMRLALKFKPGLLVNKELFNHMSSAMGGKAFAFEPSLDETSELTTSKELFFYLSESRQMGMPANLVAPNVGFRKREDYEGDLSDLYRRVHELSIVASNFGAILDFHSGSDKSPQVYRTISEACHSKLKLKMSGVYQLLYFETLASFPHGTKERELFEQIWHYTLRYAEQKAREGDAMAKRQVEQIRQRMTKAGKDRTRHYPSPEDDFFRYYSFIAVAAKRKNGRYIFRNSLYKLAQTKRVSEKYGPKVIRLTRTVVKALGLERGQAQQLGATSAIGLA